MLDKQKLLEWVNFGIERADVQMEEYKDHTHIRALINGGQDMLKILLKQIDLGTFDDKGLVEIDCYDCDGAGFFVPYGPNGYEAQETCTTCKGKRKVRQT